MRSEAAPAAGSVNLTPTNTTLASLNKLAPIISDRVVLVTHPEVTADINSEAKIIAENKEIFVSNGGNLTNLERREITNIASTGLTYTVPASAPAAKFLVGDTVTAATTAQITAFRLYSAVASSTYCDSVTISGKWTCTYCKEYVPDAEVIVAYEAAKYKIGGVLLRSDAQKTIFVVFRGSYNIPNWLAVSILLVNCRHFLIILCRISISSKSNMILFLVSLFTKVSIMLIKKPLPTISLNS